MMEEITKKNLESNKSENDEKYIRENIQNYLKCLIEKIGDDD